MEQAYGFTPTHTEQYISPTSHMCNTYNCNAQGSTRTLLITLLIVCILSAFTYVEMFKHATKNTADLNFLNKTRNVTCQDLKQRQQDSLNVLCEINM